MGTWLRMIKWRVYNASPFRVGGLFSTAAARRLVGHGRPCAALWRLGSFFLVSSAQMATP